MADRDTATNAWATFGKISSILITAAAVIAILQAIRLTRPDVEGVCYIFDIHRRPHLPDTELVTLDETKEVADAIIDDSTPSQDELESMRIRMNILAGESAQEAMTLFNYSNNPNIVCRLTNTGSRIAEALSLMLNDNVARLERDSLTLIDKGPGARHSRGQAQIGLGDLPPKVRTEIRIWTDDRTFLLADDLLITHRDGIAELELKELTLPQMRTFSAWLIWLPITAGASYLIAATIWAAILLHKKRKAQSDVSEDDPPKPSGPT